jgi:hypothetical protein
MYQKNNYSIDGNYQKFVKQSLERITSHLGNYSGGYQPQKIKKIEYNTF